MGKTYKVWVQVECHDDKTGTYENEEPVDLFAATGKRAKKRARYLAKFLAVVSDAYTMMEVR